MKTIKNSTSTVKRILVPVDFSAFSDQALKAAVQLANKNKAILDVIHVVTPVYVGVRDEELLPETDVFYSRIMKHAEDRMTKLLTKLTAKKDIEVNCKSYLDIIHRAVIAHAKRHKTDLIIMGTHGASGFKELFAGSNAFRVASESPCPVLTLRKSLPSKGAFIALPLLDDKSFLMTVTKLVPLSKTLSMDLQLMAMKEKGSKDLSAAQQKLIQQASAVLKEQGVEFKLSIFSGEASAENILKLIGKLNSSVVAVPSKNQFKLGQLFSGSYAQQFVNHSNLPVLVLPA